MPQSHIMKKAIIIFIILLIGGAWTAKKIVSRVNKSSEELERFQDYASNYGYDAEIFLSEQVKIHHDEAFAEAYQMWKFTPISEIDLNTYYDEKTYYMTLGKILNEKAKADGEHEARQALIDIGKYYGVKHTPQKKKNITTSSLKNNSADPGTNKTSPLGNAKLGDKRSIPSSRDRDNER